MIDETLKLKRFADSAVTGLFVSNAASPTGMNKEDRVHSSDLRDAVHVGFKKGLGSRQNAPAEWIGQFLHLGWPQRKCYLGRKISWTDV